MKLYNQNQIRQWDLYTIDSQSIQLIDLVSRASTIFVNWIDKKLLRDDMKLLVVAGSGNNGADAFCVANMLQERSVDTEVLFLPFGQLSLACLHYKNIYAGTIWTADDISDQLLLDNYNIVIDGIMGNGINRDLESPLKELVQVINNEAPYIMSIDIPSGMYPDKKTIGTSIFADETLSFEIPKLSFFAQSNEKRLGKWIYKSINLAPYFNEVEDSSFYLIKKKELKAQLKPRSNFAHKGTMGHAIIIGGKKGMSGAPLLAGMSAYRTGVGLVTIASHKSNRVNIQANLIESIFQDAARLADLSTYKAIGIGTGMGINISLTKHVLDQSIKHNIPLVLDADGLNTFSEHLSFEDLPKNCILTPHPKEFDRFAGEHSDDFERVEKQIELSVNYDIYIVLKGAYTTITTPEGIVYYNETGNPGMATGGSGDVLTGMITSFLAQGYDPLISSQLAVLMHGISGDVAAKKLGQEFMIARDIINHLVDAWKIIKT